MYLKRTFKDHLSQSSESLRGLWAAAASPITSEILAGSGCDVVVVDGEHSPIGIDSLVPMLQAIEPYEVTAIVRVPSNDRVIIKQVLDAGAQNIMVPMVSTVAEAEQAVSAVRYPPRGTRGNGAMLGRASRWSGVADYAERADELVSLVVQIETAQGVTQADQIAGVNGVDALFVGPADLAGSLGAPSREILREAVVTVISRGHSVGVPVGVNAFNLDDAHHYLRNGADFVFVGADVLMVANEARRVLSAFGAQAVEMGTY